MDSVSQTGASPAGHNTDGGFDDEALIAQIRDHGSTTHFRLLIQRHQQHVFDLVASVLGPRFKDRVEETAQEVFLKIHLKLDTFDGQSRFSTWAYRVAYNTAVDQLRAAQRTQSREVNADPVDWSDGHSPGPAQALAASQDNERLQRAIARLPDLYRTLIHLHYWRGLSMQDIADLLCSRPGTIKSYLHRARGRLQAMLGGRHD